MIKFCKIGKQYIYVHLTASARISRCVCVCNMYIEFVQDVFVCPEGQEERVCRQTVRQMVPLFTQPANTTTAGWWPCVCRIYLNECGGSGGGGACSALSGSVPPGPPGISRGSTGLPIVDRVTNRMTHKITNRVDRVTKPIGWRIGPEGLPIGSTVLPIGSTGLPKGFTGLLTGFTGLLIGRQSYQKDLQGYQLVSLQGYH